VTPFSIAPLKPAAFNAAASPIASAESSASKARLAP
jgi:hypothetical protein